MVETASTWQCHQSFYRQCWNPLPSHTVKDEKTCSGKNANGVAGKAIMNPVHHLSRGWERGGVIQEGPWRTILYKVMDPLGIHGRPIRLWKCYISKTTPSLDWKGKKNEMKEMAAQKVEVYGHCLGIKREAISAEDRSGADRTSVGPEAGADVTLMCPQDGVSIGPERKASLLIIFRP